MRAVRSTDTKPEKLLRSLLHRAGFRFRKNVRGLPGTPDIVFPSRRKVVFMHGCFWHQHPGCSKATIPAVRRSYWIPKLTATAARDARQLAALQSLGWEAEVVWECQLNEAPEAVAAAVFAFLDTTGLDEDRQLEQRT